MARYMTASVLALLEPRVAANAALPRVVGREAMAGATTAEATPSLAGQRRRIWEVDPKMHCSVVGTCLTLGDLYVIARRARCPIDPETSAYEVHSWFVDHMASPNELSRLVDKTLEKRHARAAQKVRQARTEAELESLWREQVGGGEAAGAYWGVMSHPLCSGALQWKFFGELHMLSHLLGAARGEVLCRAHELETTCASLDASLAQLKHDYRSSLKERRRLEEDLATQRRDRERAERLLLGARERISALESGAFSRILEARVNVLERQRGDLLARACAAEAALAEARATIEEARAAAVRAAEQAAELAAENQELEGELVASLAGMMGAAESASDGGGAGESLRSKRILCVGGRNSLVQHYRALVERHGGEFLHHDGGREESLGAVTRALGTVDAVLCPVDCVSHAACLMVKRACKNMAKPFVPLRSSGLSSFVKGLRSLQSPRSPA